MKKEIIISICIIVAIVACDIFLQTYTNKTFEIFSKRLLSVKEQIMYCQGNDECVDTVKKVLEDWNKKNFFYSLYLEHDELEKVNTELVTISSGIKNEDYAYVCEEIDKEIYILNHIADKQTPKIENVF